MVFEPSVLQNKFAGILLKWHEDENQRKMPWKGQKDPFRIWLSEIILQQTRVEQGLSYYKAFVEKYPSIDKLAAASDEQVFKLWEGLGYYSRCRNLLITARFIVRELDGIFPQTYDQILNLKGVGPYTAAAISSFAFNLPYAVVDGNVFRVLSRVFGIDTPVDTVKGKKLFSTLAQELLDKTEPGLFNQAIMDFGATVCKPAQPACPTCVFKGSCYAFLQNRVSEFPRKEKTIQSRQRWFYYVVVKYKCKKNGEQVAINKRIGKDIWQDLYEFPLVEARVQLKPGQVLGLFETNTGINSKDYKMVHVSPLFKQQLSHQLISGRFIEIELPEIKGFDQWTWVNTVQLKSYPFPRYINKFLDTRVTPDLT